MQQLCVSEVIEGKGCRLRYENIDRISEEWLYYKNKSFTILSKENKRRLRRFLKRDFPDGLNKNSVDDNEKDTIEKLKCGYIRIHFYR